VAGGADRPAEPAATDIGPAVAAGLVARVGRLAGDLRRAGVPVGLSAVIDAAHALDHIEVAHPSQLRMALLATLVTRAEDVATFHALFDARFGPPPPVPSRPGPGGAAEAGTAGADETLRRRLVQALAADDEAALAALAREAAERHAGFGTAAGGPRYRLARTLRALDAGNLAGDALRARRPGGRRDQLTELVDRTATAAALDRFLTALAADIRRRGAPGPGDTAADPDPAPPGATLPTRIEDIELTEASAVELDQLRRAVRPLARRLAGRLARQQRQRRGTLDMRRTVRRSLSSGGVPLDPAFRRRRRRRPDLWVLCDVSGSVADYARFTMGLLCAVHDEVPRLRSFLFVDDLVEITATLAGRHHEVDPFAVVAGAGVPLGGRRSDWGAALTRFRDAHLAELTRRSTVIVTGDGRTHEHDPRTELVAELARRARGVWLFDPEPAPAWATGDSAVPGYARAGMRVLEVRTLAQLGRAVETVLADQPG
jgi:hypothetical protein